MDINIKEREGGGGGGGGADKNACITKYIPLSVVQCLCIVIFVHTCTVLNDVIVHTRE